MKISQISQRYAKAIYEISAENRTHETVINELRQLSSLLTKDAAVWQFMTNPLVSADDRVSALSKALENKGISKESMNLVLTLARKDRMALFSEIVLAFEAQSDEANNVCRGVVKSATILDPTERKSIEERVEKVLNKKVIMTYKTDPTIIGGLVAQVGSYTFDDSIDSHLKRMNEELKRRTV